MSELGSIHNDCLKSIADLRAELKDKTERLEAVEARLESTIAGGDSHVKALRAENEALAGKLKSLDNAGAPGLSWQYRAAQAEKDLFQDAIEGWTVSCVCGGEAKVKALEAEVEKWKTYRLDGPGGITDLKAEVRELKIKLGRAYGSSCSEGGK